MVEGIELDRFVAGDGEDAKRSVIELVKSIGLDYGPGRVFRVLCPRQESNLVG